MNMDLVKWLGGGVMLLIWAALVATDRVKNVGAEALIQFIQYSLVGLGAHGLTVRRSTAPAMAPTAGPVGGVTLPSGAPRPTLYVPGQSGSITALLAIILVVLGLVLYYTTAYAGVPRSQAAKAAFVRIHACPATGKHRLPCPGYVIDHIRPLDCGGADAPSNMQWQTVAAGKAKDKWERSGPGCKHGTAKP